MPDYRDLVRDYCDELREARDKALVWWEDLILRELRADGDRDAAIKRLRVRWVVGPVAHPWVIAVFRKYFLMVEAHNDAADQNLRGRTVDPNNEDEWGTASAAPAGSTMLEPHAVLLENLAQVDATLGEFMRGLLFIPMGHSKDRRSV